MSIRLSWKSRCGREGVGRSLCCGGGAALRQDFVVFSFPFSLRSSACSCLSCHAFFCVMMRCATVC